MNYLSTFQEDTHRTQSTSCYFTFQSFMIDVAEDFQKCYLQMKAFTNWMLINEHSCSNEDLICNNSYELETIVNILSALCVKWRERYCARQKGNHVSWLFTLFEMITQLKPHLRHHSRGHNLPHTMLIYHLLRYARLLILLADVGTWD